MNIQTLIQNKHTSAAAIIYLGASAVGHIGAIWYPEHAKQFEDSVKYVKEACFVWGMAFAGDAAKKASDANGNGGHSSGLGAPTKDP